MNWLNIELSTLRSESYLGSDPVQRATWLNLMAYCADQENGGKICGGGEWGSRRWLQLLGITKEEVRAESCLWTWVDEDVVVWNYPKAKEAEVRAKRESGRKGGRPPKTKAEKPDGYEVLKPHGSISLKRKGKEGKGKEEERNGINTPLPPKGGESEKVKTSPESEILKTLSPERRSTFEEWLRYKAERRQNYKPTGLRNLINEWAAVSDSELAAITKQSMSNNYSGLFRLKPSQKNSQQPKRELTEEDCVL